MIFGGILFLFAGILFIGKVWGKIRPMIEINDDGIQYHAGISHTEKKGMIPVSQADLEEGTDFEIGEGAYSGLCNKSSLKLKFGEMGNSKAEFDQRLLNENRKLRKKIENRKK